MVGRGIWLRLLELGVYFWRGGFVLLWILGRCKSRVYIGGFKCFLMFTPKIGEDFHFDSYFSNGLKPPTRCWRKSSLKNTFLTTATLAADHLYPRHGSLIVIPGWNASLRMRDRSWNLEKSTDSWAQVSTDVIGELSWREKEMEIGTCHLWLRKSSLGENLEERNQAKDFKLSFITTKRSCWHILLKIGV